MVMYPNIRLDFSHSVGDENLLLADTLLLLGESLGTGAAEVARDLISTQGRGWASAYAAVAKLIHLEFSDLAELTEKMTPVHRDSFLRGAGHFFKVAASLDDMVDNDDYQCWRHELQIAGFSWKALTTPAEEELRGKVFRAWSFELSDQPEGATHAGA